MDNISNALQEVLDTNLNDYYEHRLKLQLTEAMKIALLEMEHRVATIPFVSNLKSTDKIDNGYDTYVKPNGTVSNEYERQNKASKLSYEVITHAIFDNIGTFELGFGRPENDGTTSRLYFQFKRILFLNKDRFVIEGYANMSRGPIAVSKRKPKTIQIDYLFAETSFYEAIYCANGTIRHLKKLKLDKAGTWGVQNITTAENLIHFLCKCLYSIEDGINDIVCNGTTPIIDTNKGHL